MTAILIVLGIILLICLANSGSAKPKMSKAQARKELLWKMQHCQGPEEINAVFNFYFEHEDDLRDYLPFKSWYKNFVDFALEAGIIRLKGGGEYNPKEDPLYDPNAADWYDTYKIHYYDGDDDDDDDVLEKLYEQQKIDNMTWRERKRYEEEKRRKNRSF